MKRWKTVFVEQDAILQQKYQYDPQMRCLVPCNEHRIVLPTGIRSGSPEFETVTFTFPPEADFVINEEDDDD